MRARGVMALSVAAAGVAFGVSALSARTPATSRPAVVTSAQSASDRPAALRPPPRHSLLIVGASYTAGLGATSSSDGYAEVLARDLGWPVHIDGVAGTGYLNPGPNGRSRFLDRINRLPRSLDPGLVLIQGGRNDAGYPHLKTAVCATVTDVRHRYPGAEVALLGNVPFSVPVGRAQRAVEHELTVASRTCHAVFIDPIAERWVTQLNAVHLQGHVPGHPNDAGYAYIARRLSADLATLSDGKIAPVTARPEPTAKT